MTNTKSSKVKAIDLNQKEDWITILWYIFVAILIGGGVGFFASWVGSLAPMVHP